MMGLGWLLQIQNRRKHKVVFFFFCYDILMGDGDLGRVAGFAEGLLVGRKKVYGLRSARMSFTLDF